MPVPEKWPSPRLAAAPEPGLRPPSAFLLAPNHLLPPPLDETRLALDFCGSKGKLFGPLQIPATGCHMSATDHELEFVWVVRRRDLFPTRTPHGFERCSTQELEERYLRCMRDKGFFVERREAERNPEWKQVIPYGLVKHEGEFLVLERLKAQSEARLHGLLSLGVGGHINPQDQKPSQDLIECACRRELEEELHDLGDPQIEALGLINDDSTEVGAVHVGLVFGITAHTPPKVRETEKMAGCLTPLAGLQNLCQTLSAFETWTRLILEQSLLGGGEEELDVVNPDSWFQQTARGLETQTGSGER